MTWTELAIFSVGMFLAGFGLVMILGWAMRR